MRARLADIAGSGGLVAVAGFHAPADRRAGPAWDELRATPTPVRRCGGRLPRAGPEGLGSTGRRPGSPKEQRRPDPRRTEFLTSATDDKGVAINRLIRRLRISDPPHQFQTVATTVLRTSLNLSAVAWVPKDVHEPVVVSGEIEGLSSRPTVAFPRPPVTIRRFSAPTKGREPPRRSPFSVSIASVAAGSVGWLLAINPLDDRPINSRGYRAATARGVADRRPALQRQDLHRLERAPVRDHPRLTAAIDAKDPYTSGHSERVARIAVRLAEELRMPAGKRSDLYLAGLLHDVGKIGIDDGVFKKSGPLTPEEYRRIQAHVEIGVTILKDLRKLHHILPGVRHHHESMDGTGYPDRLAGEESRSKPGSWPWPTRSTRCRATVPIVAGSAWRRSTTFSSKGGACSGTLTSSTRCSPVEVTWKRSGRRASARA